MIKEILTVIAVIIVLGIYGVIYAKSMNKIVNGGIDLMLDAKKKRNEENKENKE